MKPALPGAPNDQYEAKREALEKKQVSVGELLGLAEKHPKYTALFEKALIVTAGSARQPENRQKIAAWPDAIPSAWGVDVMATLNQRVEKEGPAALKPFSETRISGADFVANTELVVFHVKKAYPELELGENWQDEVEDIILEHA